ncbi:MAG: HlyD family type I secretion periplasmic adaptor subunit [Marinomonas sp.]
MKKNKSIFHQHHRDRYEFLPAALEVLETPPVPFGRIIAISISFFFLLAIIWSYWGTVDIVVISEGRTIPSGNVKIIQPLETGVIRAIHVKDGDTVKKGDILLELDSTDSLANLDGLKIDLEQALIDAQIGYALLQPDPTTALNLLPSVSPETVQATHDQIVEEYKKHKSAIQTIKLDNRRIEASLRASKITYQMLKETIPLIEDQLNNQKSLLKKGFTQKPLVQQLQQEHIETKASLKSAIETGIEAEASIDANLSRIDELTANYRNQATLKRLQALRQISLLEQSIKKEEKRLNYLNLRSPVDGTVQQLNIHTIGAVVSTADPLLIVVPKDTPLEIESMVLNKDIGFLKSGETVEIKFEAFPFTRYGTVTGKLVSVSNDAIINEQLGPVYKAKVSLDNQEIGVDGKPIHLSPGMNASVEIKTGTRRIIEFFLSPLLRYKDEAIRER